MHEIDVNAEVAGALAAGRPVVALESTLITHGFPAPDNLAIATAMENTVREHGAVPATIAVLSGRIKVGLNGEQLQQLAMAGCARKCSRRDLPVVIARRENGATTVAGTMVVAHWAGIRVIGTGGIGGVHRGFPFDQSADLLELARTPVAVVCAGAKSILDLPLTMEVLETRGVTVIGFETGELPAFYSRRSGLAVDVRADTPEEVADLIRAAHRLGLAGGPLVAVPVPEPDEWPAQVAEAVIQQAVADAAAEGICGKSLTPFLLARTSQLSGGRSSRANRSLLLNNARVAARIAVALGTRP